MTKPIDSLRILEEVAETLGFEMEVHESAPTPSNGWRYYTIILKLDGEEVYIFDDDLNGEWAVYTERDLTEAAGLLLERIQRGCTMGTDDPIVAPEKTVTVPPFSTVEELRMKLGIGGGKP